MKLGSIETGMDNTREPRCWALLFQHLTCFGPVEAKNSTLWAPRSNVVMLFSMPRNEIPGSGCLKLSKGKHCHSKPKNDSLQPRSVFPLSVCRLFGG